MPTRLSTPGVIFTSLFLACATCRADDPPPAPPLPALFAPAWPPAAPDGDGGRPQAQAAPPIIDLDPWAEWATSDRPRTVRNATAGDWGSLTANSVLGDAASPPASEDPLSPNVWKTDGNWRYGVVGPLSVYGQFGGNGTEVAQQDTKVAGGAGLECKWSPLDEAEFVVRSGPSLTYTDPLRPDKTRERSQWLMEVQARWPLLDKIGLEYHGTAAPALTPLDHDWSDQDLGLAAPICTGGKVRVGARYHWENVPDPKPAPDSMQLYFGLELSR